MSTVALATGGGGTITAGSGPTAAVTSNSVLSMVLLSFIVF
jgi:hypothetical protein